MSKSNKHVCRRNVALALAALGGCAGLESSAFATNFTWLGTGGNNNWDNNLNWVDQNGANVAPPLTPPAGDVTNLFWSGTFTTIQTSTQNTGPMDVNQIVLNANFNAATLGIAGSSTGDQFINLGAGGIVGNVPGGRRRGNGQLHGRREPQDHPDGRPDVEQHEHARDHLVRRVVEGAFEITKTGPGTIEFQGQPAELDGRARHPGRLHPRFGQLRRVRPGPISRSPTTTPGSPRRAASTRTSPAP